MKLHEIVRGRPTRVLSKSGRLAPSEGCSMEKFEPRVLMDAVVWDGGAGTNNWNDAANWNRNGVDALPVNGDDVTIDSAANPTIVYNAGALTLNSLFSNEALNVTGGTLALSGAADVNAPLTVNGGTLSGGTWNVTDGALRAGTSTGILHNTQIVGDITLDTSSATMRVSGSTRFTAARLSASGASLQFAPGYTLFDLVVSEGAASGARSVTGAVGGVGSLTIAPSGEIRLAAGSGGSLNINNSNQLTLINNGLISAEAAGRTLTIGNTTIDNNGTLRSIAGTLNVSPTDLTNDGMITAAAGAALTVEGTWSNAGSITAMDATLSFGGTWLDAGSITATNSAVNLGGTFTSAGLGGFVRSGGTVNLTGTMNNVGGTFVFNSATGGWNIAGGTILGGTVTFDGAFVSPTSSTSFFTDVQINGDLLLSVTSASVRIAGSTRFGAIRLAANGATAQFAPDYVLADLVVAEGAASGTRSITGAVGGVGSLTVGPTGEIRLAAGSGGNLTINNSSAMTLVNNGLISAEATGRTLSLNNSAFINNATARATAGTLDISPTTTSNAGQIIGENATLTFGGGWSSSGDITAVNSTVNLGGSFASDAFTLDRTGGTVNLTGAMFNEGNTLTFDNASGSWNFLGGSITGGTIAFSGQRLIPTSSVGTLTDVQVNGDLTLDTTSAAIRVAGDTRFTSVRLAANGTTLQIAPDFVLADLVVAEGAASGTRAINGAVGGVGSLAIAPTGEIRLAQGAGGNLHISNSSALTLINEGLISAEAAGRTLLLNNSVLTNNGTMRSIDGTLNIGPTTWTNNASITSTGATLTTAGEWFNNGSITASNATVNLGGAFTNLALGSFVRDAGQVNLTGVMNNAERTFTFNSATGSWNLAGGGITGGTVNFTDATRIFFTSSGGMLRDVDMNAELLLDSTSARVQIAGGTRFDAVRLTANGANLDFAPEYTLHDLVVAEGATAGARSIQGAFGGAGTLTISPTGEIRLGATSGGNLNIGNSSTLTLINNGLISAEASGRTLTINPTSFTNNGAARAIGGTLAISATTWSNTGELSASNATLTLSNAWTNAGSINSSDATVNLGGTFTNLTLGAFNRSGGTVNLTGVMENTGHTFTFNAASGSWNLANGTVQGGVLTFADGARLAFSNSGGSLIDVDINGELLLDTTSARVRIGGSTRFDAVRMTANGANLDFAPGYTLHDLVVSEGATTGGRSIQGASGGEGTLTISPTGEIRLSANSGGSLSISNSSTLTLINNGLISAEAGSRTLTINPTTFTNNGTVQAAAGTLSINPITLTNYAENVLTGGAWIARGGAVLNMPAETVILTNNATIGVGGPNSFPAVRTLGVNNGELRTGGGGNFTITPDGGALVNNGTLQLAPDNILTIAGDYTQAADARMIVQIQGETASDIGRVSIAGRATLNGNVTITPVNGYDPSCVNVSFLTASSRTGEFASRSFPDVAGDHQTLIIYIGTEVRFAISPPSDYNHDGVLNSQDLFDFLVEFFNEDADFNNDGVTNSQDFFDFLADFFEGCD